MVFGGASIYLIYRVINDLNNAAANDDELSVTQKADRLFYYGILSGVLNFLLSEFFKLIVDLMVAWENHP